MFYNILTVDEISKCIGKDNKAVIGIKDNNIAKEIAKKIDGFMIQGGGMESGMREKATNAPIQNEANNLLSNKRGTIAMARTSDPHSATAQFFINVADNDFLNYRSKEMFGREVVQEWGYAVFGEVVEGMDVVDKIKKVKTGNKGFHQDVPTEDVVITSVSVE